MRRILVIFFMGCGASPASKPVEKPVVPVMPPPPAAAPALPPLRIEVTSDDKIENRLEVKLHFSGKLAASTALAFRPTHAVTMSTPVARDEKGCRSTCSEGVGVSSGKPWCRSSSDS